MQDFPMVQQHMRISCLRVPVIGVGGIAGQVVFDRLLGPTEVGQHELLVALIRGRIDSPALQQALVVDLLPAGFELENTHLADTAGTEELAWLPGLSATGRGETSRLTVR